jgi:cytochrome c oxidase assembly protein subunit 11
MSNIRITAFSSFAFAALMLGLGFAAVPLYDMFCKATGFGGAAIITKESPKRVSNREFTIHFDASTAQGLPWKFEPESPFITLKAGETKTVYYKVTNNSKEEITGIASYNVSPQMAGSYFNKLSCFCFNEQTVKPGETQEMPVVFFIDPEIDQDKEFIHKSEITLSYTFFPVKNKKPLEIKSSSR